MKLRRTVGFKKEFESLPVEIQRIAYAKFLLFSNNWRHPSLNAHKLEGRTWRGHQVFDLYVTDMAKKAAAETPVKTPAPAAPRQPPWHASHYVKVMLDQFFGENNFYNA